MIKAFQKTLFRNFPRCYFATQPLYATLPAYLSPDKIKESLTEEEYNKLVEIVKAKEQIELKSHNQRLNKLRKELGDAEQARIQKIQGLLASLNEQQVEYVRYRLLAAVENEHLQ